MIDTLVDQHYYLLEIGSIPFKEVDALSDVDAGAMSLDDGVPIINLRWKAKDVTKAMELELDHVRHTIVGIKGKGRIRCDAENLKFIIFIEVDDEIGKGRCRAHDSLWYVSDRGLLDNQLA